MSKILFYIRFHIGTTFFCLITFRPTKLTKNGHNVNKVNFVRKEEGRPKDSDDLHRSKESET